MSREGDDARYDSDCGTSYQARPYLWTERTKGHMPCDVTARRGEFLLAGDYTAQRIVDSFRRAKFNKTLH